MPKICLIRCLLKVVEMVEPVFETLFLKVLWKYGQRNVEMPSVVTV